MMMVGRQKIAVRTATWDADAGRFAVATRSPKSRLPSDAPKAPSKTM
jgi:hypothetical protein